MSFGKITMAAAVALSMTSAPVLAAPASALSVAAAQAPAAESVEGENLGGGFIIPLLALAAIVAGILIVLDDDEAPVSP